MKRKIVIVIVLLLVAALLGACGEGSLFADDSDEMITIDAPNGSVSVDVPGDWSEYTGLTSTTPEEYLALTITDDNEGFAKIYYYPDDGSGDTAKEYAQMLLDDYYGDNAIGELEGADIDEGEAYYFEYSVVEKGVDDNQYNYHGYEYLIGFGANIVEVDIYYSQDTIEGKLFAPSADELLLLRRIAESVRLK